MRNKRGQELEWNWIVIVVLAIVFLVFAVLMIREWFAHARMVVP